MIKYSSEKPPNWVTLVKAMPIVSTLWDQNLIITYGDTYHSRIETTPDLIAHESVHVEQQRLVGGPENWWSKWLSDTNFRLMQELEAYRAQLAFLRNDLMSVPRQERKYKMGKYYKWVAETLSGEIYGGIVSYQQAMNMIQ